MASCCLFLIFLIPLVSAIITATVKSDRKYASYNRYAVFVWSIIANLGVILYMLAKLNPEKTGIQLIEQYKMLSMPEIDILLGADMFSTLLLLAINLSFLIAGLCNNRITEKSKTLVTTQLFFISMINGYIMAADIISFYIFFAAISMPLIVMLCFADGVHKKNILIKFGLYNLLGIILLFVAVIMIYQYKEGNIPLNTAGNVNIKGNAEYFVWLSLFFAFILRMPIWPFHYYLSSINTSMRDSSAFSVSNLIPLIGLYGLILAEYCAGINSCVCTSI